LSFTTLPPARLDALDGLRGIAILLVILLHLRWIGFGWIGVQLFFVLSGYLITRLLIRSAVDRPLGTYLKDFYARRALRILPLYFAYLIAIAIAGWTIAGFPQVDGVLPWVATFTFNVFRITSAYGHGGTGSEHVLFDHFWSLAVEEHFYLFWPLLLFFFRGHVRTLALVLIVAGPVLRAITMLAWPLLPAGWSVADAADANYFLTTSHLDAFAAGALVATLPRAALFAREQRRYGWLFAAGLLVAIGLGALANGDITQQMRRVTVVDLGFPLSMPSSGQQVWGYTLVNLLAAMAIWLSLHAKAWQRALSAAWLRYTGRISFGLYVLHFPMMLLLPPLKASLVPLAGLAVGSVLAQAIYLALVFALAGLSFRYYEQPLLDLKQRLPRTRPTRDIPVAG
jgi:peptidoglycan/LPS O-acetylase OafA/YrhL